MQDNESVRKHSGAHYHNALPDRPGQADRYRHSNIAKTLIYQ